MRSGSPTGNSGRWGSHDTALDTLPNAARTVEGIYDEAVRNSLDALAELMPVRYAKAELGESYVAAIR